MDLDRRRVLNHVARHGHTDDLDLPATTIAAAMVGLEADGWIVHHAGRWVFLDTDVDRVARRAQLAAVWHGVGTLDHVGSCHAGA